MLVHGWTSEAAFMTAFMEPLRRSGLRVVAFDFPAHGLSEGRRTNLADCARSMLAVCDHFGTIDAVVAHSFGGFVSLLVAEGGPPMEHAHLDRPLRAHLVPQQAVGGGAQLRPQPEARLGGAARLRASPGARRPSPGGDVLGVGADAEHEAPVLVIHGRDDDEVPFHNAEEIAAARPSARLMRLRRARASQRAVRAAGVPRRDARAGRRSVRTRPPARRSGRTVRARTELRHSA